MMSPCDLASGGNLGFPDPKLTPVPPAVVVMVYPNKTISPMHQPVSPNIYTGYKPSQSMASVAPITMGNNAGVMHPLFMQAGFQIMGNPKILHNCIPSKTLLNPSMGNLGNNPIGIVSEPGITTTTYTDRTLAPLAGEPSLEPTNLLALTRALEGNAETVTCGRMGDVAVLRVARLTSDAPSRVYSACKAPLRGARGLVIDLRGNPGGDTAACLELCGELLPRGAVLAVREEPGPDEPYRTVLHNRHDASHTLPVAILIDGGTASAAELFAACLQHHGRAIVVGRRSYGKGTEQAVRDRDGGGSAYTTVAELFAPDGAPIEGVGVQPDVEVPEGADALPFAIDALRR